MARYRNKPHEVVAITFEELIEHGKENSIVKGNGLPRAFEYYGHPIRYENDETYLIPTLESGNYYQKISSNDMLILGIKGEIYPCRKDIFALIYELVDEAPG